MVVNTEQGVVMNITKERWVPVLHKGPEPEKNTDLEAVILDKVIFDQLLEVLSEKERMTISMWSQGWTLQEIAGFISLNYEGRTEDNLLSPRTLGARVTKILQKLRFHFIEGNVDKESI
jgi:hypothetical protein